MSKTTIELKDWSYHCADVCCSDYGTSIIVNGVEHESEYAGSDVEKSIEFILNTLGIEFELKLT